jgi:predicted ester cyclase
MSVEENKAIARRWNDELFNKGNPDIIDELADANYVMHPGMVDREGFKQIDLGAVLSDLSITMEDMIAEDDRVAFRATVRGKHTGEYMGAPPTGKQVTLTVISIYQIKDGKIVEDWTSGDMLGFYKQLGITPDMEQVQESTWD